MKKFYKPKTGLGYINSLNHWNDNLSGLLELDIQFLTISSN